VTPAHPFAANTRRVRVAQLGDAGRRETGWSDAAGRALIAIRYDAAAGQWLVMFPLLNLRGLPTGSDSALRAAYRQADRQARLLRRDPARMARSRASALTTAWTFRQAARRQRDDVRRLTHELAALARQRDEAVAGAEQLRRELADLRLAHNGLTHQADAYRRQLGLPTSADLQVVGARPVYPLRAPSEPPVSVVTVPAPDAAPAAEVEKRAGAEPHLARPGVTT